MHLINAHIMNLKKMLILINALVIIILSGCRDRLPENYPHPAKNPESPIMLTGDWFEDPHKIDFDNLPRIPSEHAVVSDVRDKGTNHQSFNDAKSSGGVNQHNYLNYQSFSHYLPIYLFLSLKKFFLYKHDQ